MIFKGICTALVTPFDENNNIDYVATKKLIDLQIKAEVNAILLLGSTGEGFAINKDERKAFVRFVKQLLPKNIKLIVGAGSNNPNEVCALINEAKELGADACLVQTPYFVKCTQNGIVEFFKQICDKTKFPIIVYNIPSRSGVNISPSTMIELSKIKNIEGLKEANGDINHILAMFNAIGDSLPIYCGNDNLNLIFHALNAAGTISVASNIYPSAIKNLFNGQNSNLISNLMFNFNNLLFCEPNPIPIKYALSKMKIVKNILRSPLTPLEKIHENALKNEIESLKGKL